MNRILVSLFLVGSIISNAQTRYALRQIDFQDPSNRVMVKQNTDNLAVILVDAYLTGKLNAYKVGPLDSAIQSLEFPKRSVRESHSPAKKKRAERKKIFARSKTTVSILPSDLVALTKAEFLQQMVILEDEVTQWDKATRYERGKGLVFYKGLGYFPKKDTAGIAPPNKIYWELAAARDKRKIDDTAIVRIEQLYPLPHRQLAAVLERYPNAADVRWVQEEPSNQGAWPYFDLELPEKLPDRLSRLTGVSRRRMAAPAPGSSKVHEVEQKAIIDQALGLVED